ncbi:MAG: thiazole synthase [Planctomycetota bacterium]
MKDLEIGGRPFRSRLFLGTGKFSSSRSMAEAIEASGTEMVTVALRRVDLDRPEDDLLSHLDPHKVLLLVNTSGAATAKEAVRLALLARKGGFPSWVKVEVTPEPRFLMPDPIETYEACRELLAEGFTVLPYIHADPMLALRLQDLGCQAVMPLASPIGSNRGLKNEDNLRIILEQARVPVVVDAGLGAPSHAAAAMEMGAAAVLVNTAIATAGDPARMARAFKGAVEAGREAFLSKLPSPSGNARASSPLTGFLK